MEQKLIDDIGMSNNIQILLADWNKAGIIVFNHRGKEYTISELKTLKTQLNCTFDELIEGGTTK